MTGETSDVRSVVISRLVTQLEKIVKESGNPEGFDAAGWLSRWRHEPLPALGGDMPVSQLETLEGQSRVSDLLSRLASGAFA